MVTSLGWNVLPTMIVNYNGGYLLHNAGSEPQEAELVSFTFPSVVVNISLCEQKSLQKVCQGIKLRTF